MQPNQADEFLGAILAAGVHKELGDEELKALGAAFGAVPQVQSKEIWMARVAMQSGEPFKPLNGKSFPDLRREFREIPAGPDAMTQLSRLAQRRLPKRHWLIPHPGGSTREETLETYIEYLLVVENWLVRCLPTVPELFLEPELSIVANNRLMLRPVPEAKPILREREPVENLASILDHRLQRYPASWQGRDKIRQHVRDIFGLWVADRPEIFDQYPALRDFYLSWPDEFVSVTREILADYLDDPTIGPFLNA